ncbi:MAG: DUF5684 domain-containing protein [Salibacteraceae bacterium]|jgi:hypothetical protein|nr:DUF5684 domain-containing protein [Salibacteraceae bacterium]MDP4686594.1 DUF5684 domain-containing protein [Salibacteraceae bacterium]MDP4764200.1 DUF5684 domain-containing protein [Salibacteraceae bacterium]MDP4843282.1 DUF5684 domain-containing protein [Salibacteraceae bacterium]MDP4933884.1 DUF5684 domain-containing protein [Salibacteraceae bacterium]
MEKIYELFPALSYFGAGVLVPIFCFVGVGILAQWSLYDKCGLKGIDCLIPVKNVVTFLKIMGRPASHSIFVMLPPPLIIASLIFFQNDLLQFGLAAAIAVPWIVFMTKVYIELCQSFGHYRTFDYILCVVFNGFYVLHLGLSFSEKYKGPAYIKSNEKKAHSSMKSQLA